MKDRGKKIRNYIMKFSYQERRQRELEAFAKELKKYRDMTDDELKYEYIGLKTEYEHKKGILTLFVVSIALAVLTNVWNKFFGFMEQVIQYAAKIENGGADVASVSFGICVIVSIFITVVILVALFTVASDMKGIRKKFMMIEDVVKEKEHKK